MDLLGDVILGLTAMSPRDLVDDVVDPAAGIGTDYALIAGGIAATLIALTYLIMI